MVRAYDIICSDQNVTRIQEGPSTGTFIFALRHSTPIIISHQIGEPITKPSLSRRITTRVPLLRPGSPQCSMNVMGRRDCTAAARLHSSKPVRRSGPCSR